MQGKMGRARARARALYSQEPVRFEGGQIIVPASRLRGTPAGVRAGDLSRVGLAGSPNPHRSSPGGSEDGASGGCAHHRESTVHPRCPLHSAVLSFFFWRRRTACVPKTCPNAGSSGSDCSFILVFVALRARSRRRGCRE